MEVTKGLPKLEVTVSKLPFDDKGLEIIGKILEEREIIWRSSVDKEHGLACVISCLKCGNSAVATIKSYDLLLETLAVCPCCQSIEGYMVLGEV